MLSTYMIIMLLLFTNFYIHEYVTRSNDIKRRKLKSNIDESTNKSSKPNGVTKKHH